jgi:peptide/nickel transport system ATP-binding protein
VTALVETRELFRVYPSADGGVAALQGLTLAVADGEICVALGPSGSGKSTLMRVLAGIDRPSAGSVVVAGVDLAAAAEKRLARYRAELIGYADQHYWRALAGELTAEQLVGVPLGLAGAGARERTVRARELLERVGLLDRAGARPGELSGGEQQRVAFCAALAARPRLLLADEPTGELDRATAEAVYALIADLAREQRATALIVSHDPHAGDIADRVVHIRDGRVSEERSGAGGAIVVGAGGWLRIDEDLLRAAGIGSRAAVTRRGDRIELRPAGAAPEAPVRHPLLGGGAGARVEARGLVRRYGPETALDGLAATFEPGRLTAVTGPSGSGKSTLLALLAGLDLPDAGEVALDGVVVSALSREQRADLRRERIAVIGQASALSGFLSARENVLLGLALRGIDTGDGSARAAASLAAVGLAGHEERPVDRLSAGQRERVALARALAARAGVLLADEPTARVDAAATLSLGRLLARIAHEHGSTVVCATHDPLLIELADDEVRLG